MCLYGLSPRVRGNQPQRPDIQASERSIPACAGEPLLVKVFNAGDLVYPRVCGGTETNPAERPSSRGLSPRVRGNPYGRPTKPLKLRSIPACAGEPAVNREQVRRKAVYPRVCGGTVERSTSNDPEKGLSPRVRGNRRELDATWNRCRSIPACAGEPLGSRLKRMTSGVYPRVCGGTLRMSPNPQ